MYDYVVKVRLLGVQNVRLEAVSRVARQPVTFALRRSTLPVGPPRTTKYLVPSDKLDLPCCTPEDPGTRAVWQSTIPMQELPELLSSQLGDKLDTANASVTGHSMGGHGALVVGLKNPQVGGTWHVARDLRAAYILIRPWP